MTCRRCGENIGDGSKNCPLCGISQHTYITPRNYTAISSAPKKKTRKSTLISIIAMAVTIGSIFVVTYLSDKANVEKDYQSVLNAMAEQDETKLFLTVELFKKKHPDSPLVEDVERYYRIFMNGGVDPEEDSDTPPEDAQTQAERMLREIIDTMKANARDTMMSVSEIKIDPPLIANEKHGMRVTWRNMSDKNIKSVRFSFEARDAQDEPVNASGSGGSRVALTEDRYKEPNKDDKPYESLWLNVWSDAADHVRLLEVKIIYADNSVVILPAEVCDTIMES